MTAMYCTANRTRIVGLAVTTALAGALLSGCSTAAPHANVASTSAEPARVQREQLKAVAQAEAAVAAAPQDAAARATLGNAYLEVGRFASAEASFANAVTLGDVTPRTALSLSVAMMGQGRFALAGAMLDQWTDRIPAADAGLALALAGQSERGIQVMSNAIRGGQNDAKIRQNLAYAFALAGRWREARLMAAQDLSGDALDARIQQFATMVQPDAWQTRIASLLGVPAGVTDPGLPVQLALAGAAGPSSAETAIAIAAAAPAGELPALAVAAPTVELPAPPVATPAFAAAPVPEAATELAAAPVAEPAPVLAAVEAPALPQNFATAFLAPASMQSPIAAVVHDSTGFTRDRVAATSRALRPAAETGGTHLVQLGSFGSEQGARRAWKIYTAKYPQLAGHELVITKAVVRGKPFWRVAAGGYGRSGSASLCGRVKAGGAGCFAYEAGRPLPGAVDTGVRLASR